MRVSVFVRGAVVYISDNSGPESKQNLPAPSPTHCQVCNALIDPKPGIFDPEPNEMLQRVGLGTRDVLKTVAALRERGVTFVESHDVHPEVRGALTQSYLGGVMFELVHDERE